MKHLFNKKTVVILLLVSVISVGSVSADWIYANTNPDNVNESIAVTLAPYKWSGSEILPDDIEGEDHYLLIETLIGGTDDFGEVIGLNNPNSALSKNIDNRVNHWLSWRAKDYYGSMDGSWFDDDLDMEGVFNTETLGLAFIIQVVSDTKYYIYTTDVDLGENGLPSVPIGEWIYPIYRTEIVREDVNSPFDIIDTKCGKAESVYYEQILLPPYDAPSFDIDTWTETDLGSSADTANAINTFIGDSGVAYPVDETTPIYYRLKPSASGTVTVQSTRLDIEIKILAADGATIIAEGNMETVDGANVTVATFSASANTDYYIEYSGAASIPFSVS